MIEFLFLAAIVIFASVFLNKVSGRIGIPMLLAFILLGMAFGSEGIVRITFQDFSAAGDICSVALIFIMFYGGFGTNWKQARQTAPQAAVLSTLGVVLTALLTGAFCRFVFQLDWVVSLLLGSVIASTDAASVFSILRSKKLNLKYNTASLLEVESGSNDPAAYMMMTIFISMLQSGINLGNVTFMIAAQIGLGVLFGAAIAVIAKNVLRKFHFQDAGFDMIFVVGVAVASYAVPELLGGNGYLSAYITGLMLGNSSFKDKKNIVHFFDGMTGLMQVLIFFLLGLLATPSKIPAVVMPAVLTALFLTFVARPVSVFSLLAPFKGKVNQNLLISFAGLRGAAAIVFAIIAEQAVGAGGMIFHTVFTIVLLSILFQGSLLPAASRKFNMIDENADVMKSFTDYTEEVPVRFIQFRIPQKHKWEGKRLHEITLPPETLVILIEHGDEKIIPNGQTILEAGDKIILSAGAPEEIKGIYLSEIIVDKKSAYIGKKIADIDLGEDSLVILIERGNDLVIPQGNEIIRENDILVLNKHGA